MTYGEPTNGFDVIATGLEPTGKSAPPTGVGHLVTAPTPATFNGLRQTTSAAVAPIAGPKRPAVDFSGSSTRSSTLSERRRRACSQLFASPR